MDIREKIRELVDSDPRTDVQISRDLGINRNTLANWSSTTYLRVNDLIRVAMYFEKPISYFFEDYYGSTQQSIKGKNIMASMNGNVSFGSMKSGEEIKHLRNLLCEKDKIVSEKERVIQLLMEQNELLKRDCKRDKSESF